MKNSGENNIREIYELTKYDKPDKNNTNQVANLSIDQLNFGL